MKLTEKQRDKLMVAAFQTVWKVLGQAKPDLSNRARFLLCLSLVNDDTMDEATLKHCEDIDRYLHGDTRVFSDALTRRR